MDKPTKHVISINSKHNKTNNLSNAIYDFGSIELQEAHGCRLKDVSIVNLIYNINTGKNDVLDYNYNGVDKTITVPEGSYNATSMAQTLNLLQTDVVFSINLITQKYVITGVLNSFVKSTSTIKNVLGFSVDTTPSLQYELPNPFNFIRTNFINIVSNLASSNACLTSDKKNYGLICQIPVNLPFGFVLQRSEEQDSSDNYVFHSNINLSEVKIKILDDDFEEIDLNQGTYNMTFIIYKR